MYSEKQFDKPVSVKLIVISLGCMIVYSLAYFIWGEKLPVSGGLGWDGVVYAAYATNFIHEITTTADVYHVTRIFPSLIIYCVAALLKLKLTTPYAACVAFHLLNTAMLLGTAYLWYKICRLKAFNAYIYSIGFISLFINYACLKIALYSPVSVDTSTLFLGMCILYLYLRQQYILIGIMSFLVFFTWPIAILLVLPLFIYPFSDSRILNSNSPRKKIYAVIAAALFSVCVSLLLDIVLYHSNLIHNWFSVLYSWNQAWWPSSGRITPWIYFVLPVNMIIASVYVYYVALYSNIFNAVTNMYRIISPNLVLYLLLTALCSATSYWLSHLSPNYTGKTIFTGTEFIAITLLSAIAKPALNLVMHATFLGPCTILWLFYMRPLIKAANEESFGLLIFVIITYFMALNSHSRQLTFNVPFMIYLLCNVLNTQAALKNKANFLIAYFLAALAGSKIYILINAVPFQGGILSDSYQRFFMNFGLWTRWPGYFFNVELTLVMCVLLYIGTCTPFPQISRKLATGD